MRLTVLDRQEGLLFGFINKISAQEGKREQLADILSAGTHQMPGCLSYTIAFDSRVDDVIWVTEVWETQEAHQASLSLPAVQDAIAKGRPLIAGMENVAETAPLIR